MKFLLLLLPIFIYANDIVISIKYNNEKPDSIINTTYEENTTALELLKKVANVTTSDGKYKFVRSINGYKSEVGVFGWFYTIDGKNMKVMASDYKLKNNSTMTWVYKAEVCY